MTFSQTRGATPELPAAQDVALEAGVTQERAASVITAAWAMVEAYTGRNYWPVTAAVLIGEGREDATVWWPRKPAPEAVTVERLSAGAWVEDHAPMFVEGPGYLAFAQPGKTYRLTQVGEIAAAPSHTAVEAVRALALYQLIHSPARREFRQVQSADTTMTREAYGNVMAASGAGMLLAGEVRW